MSVKNTETRTDVKGLTEGYCTKCGTFEAAVNCRCCGNILINEMGRPANPARPLPR